MTYIPLFKKIGNLENYCFHVCYRGAKQYYSITYYSNDNLNDKYQTGKVLKLNKEGKRISTSVIHARRDDFLSSRIPCEILYKYQDGKAKKISMDELIRKIYGNNQINTKTI